jgi:hypothetical protein
MQLVFFSCNLANMRITKGRGGPRPRASRAMALVVA